MKIKSIQKKPGWKRGWRPYPANWVYLQRLELLFDYPEYQALFDLYEIEQCPMFTSPPSVEKTLGAVFDADLVFTAPGNVGKIVRKKLPQDEYVLDSSAGHMVRYGEHFEKYLIVIATAAKEIKAVDKSTVLRMFGHYCEQRILAAQPMYKAYEMRDTAYKDAVELVNRALPNAALPEVIADNLTAWLNAIWLCWIFNLDQRWVIIGMVLDEISNPQGVSSFISNVMSTLKPLLTDRESAERFFRIASGSGFDNCFDDRNVVGLCQGIDKATRMLLHSIPHIEAKEITNIRRNYH